MENMNMCYDMKEDESFDRSTCFRNIRLILSWLWWYHMKPNYTGHWKMKLKSIDFILTENRESDNSGYNHDFI